MVGALGAIVDYWPAARQAAPQLASTHPRTEIAPPDRPSAALNFQTITDTPTVPARTRRRPATAEPRVEPAVYVAPPAVDIVQSEPAVAAPVPVPAPVVEVPRSIEPQPVTTLNAPTVELTVPAIVTSDFSAAQPEALNLVQVSPSQPPNDGFFSIAAKKTTASLAKTGSTIAGAFRTVGGAVSDAFTVALRRFF